MAVNKRMKQTKCPIKGMCVDYGNCADCTWHKIIEKYEKKLVKKDQEAKHMLGEQVQRYVSALKKETEIRKEVAKEILEIVANKTSCDFIPMKQFDWFKELVKKYGVEIEK